jgi:hypothetical protein
MTKETLDKGLELIYDIQHLQNAIYALENGEDRSQWRTPGCFLVPFVKEAMLSTLNEKLSDLLKQFDQL